MARKKSITKEFDEVDEEIHEVQRYEYLLLEYLKEMSNEITYLLIIVCGLFLFLAMDFIPAAQAGDFALMKTAFIIIIIGCFALFGLSTVTKRRIENRFKSILRDL